MTMTLSGLSKTVTRFLSFVNFGRLAQRFLREADDRVVVRMLLRQLVEHGGGDLFLVGDGGCVGFGEIFLVKRKRGFVDRRLRRGEIGARAFHDLLHRQIGSEGEAEFLAKLLGPEPEIAVRAREKILLQPLLVFFERDRGFLLERSELLLHLRHAIEHRIQSFAHETRSRPASVQSRSRCKSSASVQVCLRLRDHLRYPFHALAHVRDRLRRRSELARDEQIEAVGEALVVKQRIPLGLLQFLEAEDFAFDVLFQDAEVDAVRAG